MRIKGTHLLPRLARTAGASFLVLAAAMAISFAVPRGAERDQSAPPAQQPPAQQKPPAQQPPAQQQPPTQQDPDRQQQPTFRTGINFVRVDVIISGRDGEPVLDLKPEEFNIEEDGKPQKVESFQVIKIDPIAQQIEGPTNREPTSPSEERREAQRPDVRLFIILLDDYHVRRGNDMVVRKPLIDFIQNQLGPADMVALMYPLTPVTDLTFTRNRDSLTRAIEKFEGRRFNYNPRNEFEENYAYYPAAAVEKIRNDVTLSALEGATVKLAGMREGRKSIILVSEGFTAMLPPQLNDPVAAMPGFNNPARNNPNLQNDERAEFRASTEMLSDLEEVFREANRNNTSIYAVDPRGLAAFEFDINQGVGLQSDRKYLENSLDTLRVLAANTDGRAIVNRNDLGSGDEADHQGRERLLPVGLQLHGITDRRQVSSDQGQGDAPRRRCASQEGLLGLYGRRRRARDGVTGSGSATGGDQGAGRARRTTARTLSTILGRHVARRKRAHRGDVRLGADPPGPGREADTG